MNLGTLCYLEHSGKTLMLYRNKKENDMHKGKWVAPGGKIEPDETPEECIVREFYEETGLTLTNPKLRGILTFPDDGIAGSWLVFLFQAEQFSGTLRQCDEGELEWIDSDKLANIPMHGGDIHFIRLMKERAGIFSAKIINDSDGFKSITLMGEY